MNAFLCSEGWGLKKFVTSADIFAPRMSNWSKQTKKTSTFPPFDNVPRDFPSRFSCVPTALTTGGGGLVFANTIVRQSDPWRITWFATFYVNPPKKNFEISSTMGTYDPFRKNLNKHPPYTFWRARDLRYFPRTLDVLVPPPPSPGLLVPISRRILSSTDCNISLYSFVKDKKYVSKLVNER